MTDLFRHHPNSDSLAVVRCGKRRLELRRASRGTCVLDVVAVMPGPHRLAVSMRPAEIRDLIKALEAALAVAPSAPTPSRPRSDRDEVRLPPSVLADGKRAAP